MQPDSPDVAPASISARLRISLVAATDTAGETLDAEKLAQAKTGTRRSRQAANGIEPAPRRNETRRERVRDGSRPAPPAEDLAGDVPADERIARAPAPAGEPAQRREGERLGLIPDRPSQSNRDAAAPGRAPAQDDRDSERPRSDGKADANEDSDTDRAAVAYSVTVGVTNHPGVLGALQFDIIFRGDAGGFAGAAGSAKCFSEIPAALSTFNDKGKGTLSGALIDLEGIQTPGAIATCTFKSRSAVGPSDFSVTVVDASPPDTGKSLPEFPQMAVIDLRAAK
jgi:hypothetical protein